MLHFRQKDRRINDPNGTCFWKGKYHMFFQHRDEDTWAWGHAVSTDLLHWETLEDVFLPAFRVKKGERGFSGAESCWSGGICIDGKRAVAVFYGHSESADTCGIYVMTASDDMLCDWHNVTDGPALYSVDMPNEADDLTNPTAYGSVPYCEAPMLYDPYIWFEDGIYHLLSGGVARDKYTGGFRRQAYLYTSSDLVNWEFRHPLITDFGFQEITDDCACPYILPWRDGKTEGDAHRLLLHYSHQYGPRYVMGYYDKERKLFSPYSGERISKHSLIDSYQAPALFAGVEDGTMLAVYVMHGRGMPSVMSMVHKLERCGERLERLAVSPAVDIYSLPCTRTVASGEEDNIGTAGDSSILLFRIKYDSGKAPVLKLHRADGEVIGTLTLHVGAAGRIRRNHKFTFMDSVSLVMNDCDNTSSPLSAELPPTNGIWELTVVIDRDTVEIFFPEAMSIGRRIHGNTDGMYLSLENGTIINGGKETI